MDLLDSFTDLKVLGALRLNELASKWLATPRAREHAVKWIVIKEIAGKISLSFGISISHAVKNGETYIFPFDDLVNYLAEYGITSGKKRDHLLTRYKEAMKRFPKVGRHFTINFKECRLWLACKTPGCHTMLKTEYTLPENAKFSWDGGTAKCKRCGQAHRYEQADLFILPESGK